VNARATPFDGLLAPVDGLVDVLPVLVDVDEAQPANMTATRQAKNVAIAPRGAT
jgi:hypothetical protein